MELNYTSASLLQSKKFSISNSVAQGLKTFPLELLPNQNGVYYTILGAILDYDNIDIDISGSANWQIVSLPAFSAGGGNANLGQFSWLSSTYQQAAIINTTVGINAGTYPSAYRGDSIILYCNINDPLADFNYCFLSIYYAINAI
jgi:hypothetical protein